MDVAQLLDWTRILTILAVALAAHGLVLLVRWIGEHVVAAREGVHAKLRTATSLFVSVAVFAVYFVALGLVLAEFGISLAAYFASVSIIGIAVGFGSQGLVQDAVTGLTLIFSDIFDLGDMVELGGQTGVVRSMGIRFTVLRNFLGADVFIPNRSIGSVVTYPKGYVRAIVDFRLPEGAVDEAAFESRIAGFVASVNEELPGLFRAPPSLEGLQATRDGRRFLRVKFRIWPGQGGVLEGLLKNEAVALLQALASDYAAWMVVVAYEAEAKSRQLGRGT